MDGVSTGGEGSCIYNCLLCDSYALVTLGLLPDKKLARGLKGKRAFEDLLETWQQTKAKETVYLLACPTCNTLARQSSCVVASSAPAGKDSGGRDTGGDRSKGGGDVEAKP